MTEVTFAQLGLSDAMLKALEKKGYGYPTTIQAEAIPHFLQWKDVIAKAPTGTGKTFAFGIPMIEHIKSYIYILNIRNDYTISLMIEIPEELMDLEIPKMTLQPLVENAFVHAIEPTMHSHKSKSGTYISSALQLFREDW